MEGSFVADTIVKPNDTLLRLLYLLYGIICM